MQKHAPILCIYTEYYNLFVIVLELNKNKFSKSVLQIGRSLVRSQMVSLEFFIDINLPIALWPWGRLSLQQK